MPRGKFTRSGKTYRIHTEVGDDQLARVVLSQADRDLARSFAIGSLTEAELQQGDLENNRDKAGRAARAELRCAIDLERRMQDVNDVIGGRS